MKPCGLLLFFVVLFTGIYRDSALSRKKHDKIVVCYVASWAFWRPEGGKFQINHLQPELCTHFVYAFAGLNHTASTIRSLDPWLDIELGNYRKMTQLRRKYPEIKFSLAIGGYNEGSKNYSRLVSSPKNRKTFVDSVLVFLRKYDFDGFDLDWEFPGSSEGATNDKENFVHLVKELKKAFGRNYLLTAAISANPSVIDKGLDVPKISEYLDFIHVMAYDYHGTWDGKALPNSPLKGNDDLSVETTVEHLLKKGALSRKLVIGLPMYGRTFTLGKKLDSIESSPIGEPTLKEGPKGPFTGENGFMGYNEICQELVLRPKEWIIGWDEKSSTPFAVKEESVIVYDNPKSLKAKIDYIMGLKLAGLMIWSIDTDDFHGNCFSLKDALDPAGKDYPLMRSINMVLANYSQDTESITTESSVTTLKPKPGSAEIISLDYSLTLLLTLTVLAFFF